MPCALTFRAAACRLVCLVALIPAAGPPAASADENNPELQNDLADDLPGRIDMRPLWDGRTLDGWQALGDGDWKIDDEILHGTRTPEQNGSAMLVTAGTFGDFVLSLEYLARQGQARLCFRAELAEPAALHGLQVVIGSEQDTGGLHEASGRGWLVRPAPEEVRTWHLPEQWNRLTVVAEGAQVVIYVNGQRTAELHDDPGRLRGRIALLLSGDEQSHLKIRNVRIAELDPPEETIETDPPTPAAER